MIQEWNQRRACHHHPTSGIPDSSSSSKHARIKHRTHAIWIPAHPPPCNSTCRSTKAPNSPEMSAQTTRPMEGTATRPFRGAQHQTMMTMQATLIRHWRQCTASESTTCAFAATPAGCKVNVAQTQTTASTRLQRTKSTVRTNKQKNHSSRQPCLGMPMVPFAYIE